MSQPPGLRVNFGQTKCKSKCPLHPGTVRVDRELIKFFPDSDDCDSRVPQCWRSPRASEAGVYRGSDTQLFMWGILICISPPQKNLILSHANCMQHVLRCWERQFDGTEYKKTIRRPGSAADPAEGAYSAHTYKRRLILL